MYFWGKRSTDLTQSPAATRWWHFVTDHQFSVRAVIDGSSKAVHERAEYDAHGRPKVWLGADIYPINGPDGQINFYDYSSQYIGWFSAQDPRADLNGDGTIDFHDLAIYSGLYNNQQYGGCLSDANPLGPMNVIGFAGYHWDEELGLWLSRHRVYDPELGRWIQRDPAGYIDGLSLYLYVGGNPFSFIDPTGLFMKWLKNEVQIWKAGLGNAPMEVAGAYFKEIGSETYDLAAGAVMGVADIAGGVYDVATGNGDTTVVGQIVQQMHAEGVGKTLGAMGANAIDAAGNHFNAVMSGDFEAMGDTFTGIGGVLLPGPGALKAVDIAGDLGKMGKVASTVDKTIPAGACFIIGTPVYLGSGSPVVIESIDPGVRVVTSDPASSTADADWADWVLLDLVSSDGLIEIRTLRSRAWYDQADWDRDGDVWFEIDELGLADELEVMKISPAAPAIADGRGRVVLSTIRSFSQEVIELRFEGSDEPVTATPSHRFFSADRGDWVEAADLAVGEAVRSRDGSVRLTSARLLHDPQWVYNLEVDSDHEYFAGTLGLLVHNAGGCAAGPIRSGRAPEFDGGELTESQFLNAAQRYLGEGYAETKPGRFVSEGGNGSRVVRYGQHETRNPGNHHAHFESSDKNGIVTENTRVKLNPDE